MKKFCLMFLIALLCMTGCSLSNKETENSNGEEKETISNNTNEEIKSIESCPGCVFAFYNYDNRKFIFGTNNGTNERLLTDEYTKDYIDLVERTGKKYFLGHILDSNGNVLRSFSCGIEGTIPFCIEGSTDGSKYSSNINILNEIYHDCNASSSIYDSSCSGVDVNASSNSSGSVNVNVVSGLCYVNSEGYSYCY